MKMPQRTYVTLAVGPVSLCHLLVLHYVSFVATLDPLPAYPAGCRRFSSTLDCSYQNITVFPTNFTQPDTVVTLNLAGNKLTQISATDLDFFKNLESLDLSGNNIDIIEDGAFRQLERLAFVDVSSNRLKEIPDGTFTGLSNLTSLNLSGNGLQDLKQALNGASGLMMLRLSQNKIKNIADDAFSGSTSIQKLDLEGNMISAIPEGALQTLPSLEALVLSNNLINKLTNCSVGALKTLKTLRLDGNNISSISPLTFLSVCGQDDNSSTMTPTSTLTWLNLADNNLVTVPSEALSSLSHLETLILDSNKFTHLRTESFKNMSKLLFLSTSFLSDLEAIENATFVNLEYLNTLYIHHCPRLTSFVPTFLSDVPNLKVLKLNKNGLTTIDKSLVTWGENFTLTLDDNPFVCNCELNWLPEFYRGEAMSNISKANLNKLRCASPAKLKNKLIVELKDNEFRCPKKMKSAGARVKTAILAASICVVLAILLLVFVKCRNRICIFVKRQFRYKAHRDNRELFSVKLSEIIGDNDHDPYYEDPNIDLRLRSLVES